MGQVYIEVNGIYSPTSARNDDDDDDDRATFTINSSNDYLSPLINSHIHMMALSLIMAIKCPSSIVAPTLVGIWYRLYPLLFGWIKL